MISSKTCKHARPRALAVPHQIIDYTYGREHSCFDGESGELRHVDFTEPYDRTLRAQLLAAAAAVDVPLADGGVYGATQGPRLETAAEIDRMDRDGCTLVGMTGMPEAAIARELDLAYAHCAVVVNEAAGRGPGQITMDDIRRNLTTGMDKVIRVLRRLAADLAPR